MLGASPAKPARTAGPGAPRALAGEAGAGVEVAQDPVYNSMRSLEMTASVLVVDDRLRSAAALAQWLGANGVQATVSATWAEAADTLAYQQLAGTALPVLVIGPLAKDGVTVLADLRAQGIDLPTAFYTESKSRDQDETLVRQYRLVAILHKPFAEEDCGRLLAGAGGAGAPSSDDIIGSSHLSREEPPPIPTSAPPPLAAPRTSAAPAKRDTFDDLIGSSRGSSVRADAPPPKAKTFKAEELPSGVQRLLVDPTAGAQREGGGPPKSPEDAAASSGPRPISILAVEDKNNSARLLVERLGMPSQTTRAAATYAEALLWLERLMQGSTGCELVIGPLSADGVAAVREYRRRGWQNHVVFYTESTSQSQDPRLPAQYGCLAIVRRSGMVEQLERLIADLRAKPRQPAAVPGASSESGPRAASSSAAARMSGLHAAPPESATAHAPAAAPAPAPAAQAAPPAPARPATRTSGIFAAPPGAPAPATSPGSGTGRIDSNTGRIGASRVRRSISLPPAGAPAAPAEPGQAPLEIDVGGGDAPPPAAPPRVVTCSKCKQEFVVTVRPGLKATCPHCGIANI
jgi:CheY-like chemotaxis protein